MNGIPAGEIRIIVPLRNGGERWKEAATALRQYAPAPESVIVIDSDSQDGSGEFAERQGFTVERIDVRDFNHGRTRQQAVDRHCGEVPVVILLTQDAVLEGRSSLTELLAAFADPRLGAAYGRQLPHRGASPMAAYANQVNYPDESATRTMADAGRLGMKVAYLSNSFAAYRMDALRSCGGFPSHLILGEDTYVALRMLTGGWCIRYCAQARVFHSHNYGLREEFERFFDYGVLHTQFPQLASLGSAESAGLALLRAEIRHIGGVRPLLIPELVLRAFLKYAGYRLGRGYERLPVSLCRQLSMTRGFWGAAR
jgi:rhamnosyltransferase